VSKKHSEQRLEQSIEYHLIEKDGYVKGSSDDFDTKRALEPARVMAYIEATQKKSWQRLQAIHGSDTEKVVLDDLCKTLETQGMLNVLRYGFKSFGKKFNVATFAPSTQLNPDTLALYEANTLSVTRQLFYSSKNDKSLDMVLFLNGLPIVTIELKNPLSGQNVEHAKNNTSMIETRRKSCLSLKSGH